MRQKSLPVLALFCALVQLLLAQPTLAASQTQAVCDHAARIAAQASNVPLAVLMSISRVESGRNLDGELHPWPWTINNAGQGHFFENLDAALDYAAAQLDIGNTNFDVGCFQINLRWHAKGFTSLENAFDPLANATYAAKFLTQLYDENANWADAVSDYHSRTPEHAKTYLAKIKSTWQRIKNAPVSMPATQHQEAPLRVNNFPLLQAGSGVNGSLVPQALGAGIKFGLW
jgi:hypothetical protein